MIVVHKSKKQVFKNYNLSFSLNIFIIFVLSKKDQSLSHTYISNIFIIAFS